MSVPDGIQLTPFDPEYYADPYRVYERLREVEPVHRDRQSLYPESWTISGYQQVRALLRHPHLSANAEEIGMRRDPRADNPVTQRPPDMMNLEGAAHRRLRSLVELAFKRSTIATLTPMIEQLMLELLDPLPAGEIDLLNRIAKPLPTMVIAKFLGFDSADQHLLKGWTDTLLLQGYPMPTPEQWQLVVQADKQMRSYVQQTLQHKLAHPGSDMSSQLLAVQQADAQQLTLTEVEDLIMLLVGAGNFTTTDLISNSVLVLLSHPDWLAWLQADPVTRVDQVVREVLRFDGPSMVVRRFVTKQTEFDGHTFSPGSVVHLHLGAANHDPSVFEQPDVFNPTRDPQPDLAFGYGHHHCLGAQLAQLETQIVLTALLQRYTSLNLVQAKRSKNMSFRGCSELRVVAA